MVSIHCTKLFNIIFSSGIASYGARRSGHVWVSTWLWEKNTPDRSVPCSISFHSRIMVPIFLSQNWLHRWVRKVVSFYLRSIVKLKKVSSLSSIPVDWLFCLLFTLLFICCAKQIVIRYFITIKKTLISPILIIYKKNCKNAWLLRITFIDQSLILIMVWNIFYW